MLRSTIACSISPSSPAFLHIMVNFHRFFLGNAALLTRWQPEWWKTRWSALGRFLKLCCVQRAYHVSPYASQSCLLKEQLLIALWRTCWRGMLCPLFKDLAAPKASRTRGSKPLQAPDKSPNCQKCQAKRSEKGVSVTEFWAPDDLLYLF